MIRIFSTEVAQPTAEIFDSGIQRAHEVSQIRHSLKSVFFSWPNLQDATRRLGETISCHFPDVQKGAGNLFSSTLIRATQAFVHERSKHQSELSPPRAYLEALLDASFSIAHFDVFGIDKNGNSVRWQMNGPGLPEFAAGYRDIGFADVQPNVREMTGVRLMLISKILTIEDTSLLDMNTLTRPPEPLCDINTLTRRVLPFGGMPMLN